MYKLQNKTGGSLTPTSHTLPALNFVSGSTSFTLALLLAVALCFASIPAFAQGRTWQVDPQYSFARMSVGSGSQSHQVDVTPVSGKVVFGSNDPVDPVVELKFKPNYGLGQDRSAITFKSTRSAINREGNLAVVGDLSVTRIEASATWDPTEAYSGPEYGEPVVQTETREVTLMLPGASLPSAQNGPIRLSASTTIGREDFPQLLAGLESGNTPGVAVESETCTVPSTVSEDYSGLICTGTPVATVTNNVATIAFDLKLTQLPPTTSASSAADASAGH